jgi:hypothetical protein
VNGPNTPAVTSALPAMPDAAGNFKGIRVPKLPASMEKEEWNSDESGPNLATHR